MQLLSNEQWSGLWLLSMNGFFLALVLVLEQTHFCPEDKGVQVKQPEFASNLVASTLTSKATDKPAVSTPWVGTVLDPLMRLPKAFAPLGIALMPDSTAATPAKKAAVTAPPTTAANALKDVKAPVSDEISRALWAAAEKTETCGAVPAATEQYPALIATIMSVETGRSLARILTITFVAIASAVHKQPSQRTVVAAHLLRVLPVIIPPVLHAAAAPAVPTQATTAVKKDVESRVVSVTQETPSAKSAQAPTDINSAHVREKTVFLSFFFQTEDGTGTGNVLFQPYIKELLAFLLLLLFWFAVATWVPVYILPLLCVPALVRARILQQLREARAVVARGHGERQRGGLMTGNWQQATQSKKNKDRHNEEEEEEEKEKKQHKSQQWLLSKTTSQQQQQQQQQHREWQLQTLKHRVPTQQADIMGQPHKRKEEGYADQSASKQIEGNRTQDGESARELNKAKDTLLAARNRGMGFLHAVLASALGTYCLLFEEDLRRDKMHCSTLLSTFDSLLLTSYFTWDLTSILLHWRHDSCQWLLHCVLSLLAIIHPLIATAEEPRMSYYAVALSLFELSTPFLSLRYFCLKARGSNSGSSSAAEAETATAGGEREKPAERTDNERTTSEAAASGAVVLSGDDEEGSKSGSSSLSAREKEMIKTVTILRTSTTSETAEPAEEEVQAQRTESEATAHIPTSLLISSAAPAEATEYISAIGEAHVKGYTKGIRTELIQRGAVQTDAQAGAAAITTRCTREAIAAAGKKRGADSSAAASLVDGRTRKKMLETTGMVVAAKNEFPRAVRLYENTVSVAFTLTFFFVRIVWGNFFLFPEIYAQLSSSGGDAIPHAKRSFFLVAMPIFGLLNTFWLVLLIKLLLQPNSARRP